MEKLKYIKIEHQDGTLSENVPIGVDANNVDVGNEDLSTKLNRLDANDINHSNSINSLQSQVSSLASGSPAGVYATVAALTSADPDHSKIYVVTADGHWYYYNNGWQDGGVYQASRDINEIDNLKNLYLPIRPNKTSFFNIGLNKFDKDDPECLFGAYMDENGNININNNYNQTGYIPVTVNEKYVTNYKDGFVLYFDKKRNFISKVTSATFISLDYLTIPSNVAYARFIFNPTHWNDASIQNSASFTTYSPYEAKIKDELFTIKNISENQTTFFEIGRNKFNPEDPDIVNGGYYNQTQTLVTVEGYHQTGYIPVESGKKYTASYTSAFVLWFDDNKSYLDYTGSFDFARDGYVTAITNAAYARFISTDQYWTYFQVEQGESLGTYTPYKMILKEQYIYNPVLDNTNGLKLTTYGDSIVYRNAWQPFLLNKYNFVHTNLGIGSTTMAYVANVEQDYPCMINETRITNLKNSNPDIVIIMGGTNDCHRNVVIGTDTEFSKALDSKDKTTFKGAYSFLIETLLTWKPTLKIILMTPMHSYAEVTYSYNNSYDDFAQATRDVAHYYSLNIIDTNNFSGISKFDYNTYTVDGIHPNEIGGRIIANLANEIIKRIYEI